MEWDSAIMLAQYQPFPHGWFMALFLPTINIRISDDECLPTIWIPAAETVTFTKEVQHPPSIYVF